MSLGRFFVGGCDSLKEIWISARDVCWLDLPSFRREVAKDSSILMKYSVEGLDAVGILFFSQIGFAVSPVVCPAPNRAWARSMIDDGAFYFSFCKFLTSLGIPKRKVVGTFFWPYGAFGSYVNGKYGAFKIIDCGIDMRCRAFGFLLPRFESQNFLDELRVRLIRDAVSFVRVSEDEDSGRGLSRGLQGIGRLIGEPLFGDSMQHSEKIILSRELLEFLSNWSSDKVIEGSYLDFLRGRFGSGLVGPLRPNVEIDFEICERRLSLIEKFVWTPYLPSIEYCISQRVEGEELPDRKLQMRFVKTLDELKGQGQITHTHTHTTRQAAKSEAHNTTRQAVKSEAKPKLPKSSP